MLRLDVDTIYQAIGQALHLTTATRQSRKGLISSWKAFAPALAGKVAIEAVDRAMRGEGSPAPIWEGEDGVIAWLLAGPERTYQVPLPAPGEPKRAILDSYTKEHSAEYQSQAPIDLARRLRERIGDLDQIATIVLHTSHHTHYVIGTGSGDPQKFDPDASRETLDHSLPYIFAVALQDGTWHHELSYAPERAHRPDTVELWHKISTVEDPEWTRRYHSNDPAEKAFGARAEVTLKSGEVITDELAVADAHPLGARPFEREQYIGKFTELADGVVEPAEQQRFLDAVQLVSRSEGGALGALNVRVIPGCWTRRRRFRPGFSGERRAGLLAAASSAAEKRAAFRAGLNSGRLQRFPGAFSPLVAKLVAESDSRGSTCRARCCRPTLGLPDIGLTTLTEVVTARGAQIAGGHRPAHADRRRHRIRRADERRAHRDAAGGRRAGRLPPRGPGQPEAMRAPRRQGRRPGRGDGQAPAGGGGRAP